VNSAGEGRNRPPVAPEDVHPVSSEPLAGRNLHYSGSQTVSRTTGGGKGNMGVDCHGLFELAVGRERKRAVGEGKHHAAMTQTQEVGMILRHVRGDHDLVLINRDNFHLQRSCVIVSSQQIANPTGFKRHGWQATQPDKDDSSALLCRGVLTLPHIASGKVREIYEIDAETLLFVATDRISAYDVILNQTIPDKGRVLTGLSLHFFDLMGVPNHFVGTDLTQIHGLSAQDRDDLAGRAMLVRKAEVIPVECVVRGYLYGSSWREYRDGGGPTTEHLPNGLKLADKLAEPIFTPATKAESGHDENLTETQTRDLLGDNLYNELKRRSLAIYTHGAEYAADRGVILADTKFEFGFVNGDLLLIDEVLTPDSSRYWPADQWVPGNDVPSFDKQYVREWLERQPWDKNPPPPELPDEIVEGSRARYVEAYERITGGSFDDYLTGDTT